MAASQAGSLVDFTRKTGADLALLEAKTGEPKRLLGKGNTHATDGISCSSAATTTTSKRRRRRTAAAENTDGQDSRDTDEDVNADLKCGSGGRGGGGGRGSREASRGDAEVNFTDEFGRDRTVPRGGPEHRAHLEAKKAATEKKVEEEAERESYDERYSYRGNRGSAPPPPYANADAFGGSGTFGGGTGASAGDGGGGGGGGGWAWGSGVGRGTDAGDFETREGQERRAKKGMAELLEREGVGEVGRDESGAKVCTAEVEVGCVGRFVSEKRLRPLLQDYMLYIQRRRRLVFFPTPAIPFSPPPSPVHLDNVCIDTVVHSFHPTGRPRLVQP